MLRAAAKLPLRVAATARYTRASRQRGLAVLARRPAAAAATAVLASACSAAGVVGALALGLQPAASSFAAAPSAGDLASALRRADDMYDNPALHTRQQLYDALASIDLASLDAPAQAEVLWRLTRATYELSQEPTLVKAEKEALVREAYAHVQAAVAADEGNFKCHSWFGIILNEVGDLEGSKKKISYLYIVEDHWLRAAELNPRDATSQHLLGRWCYGIVTISSVMYWAARALFGKLPDTSWEEAYGFFAAAEDIEPGFWKKNLVMLAVCEQALNRPEAARGHLLKALTVPVKTHEDRESHEEAKKLLQQHFNITDAPEVAEVATEEPASAVAAAPPPPPPAPVKRKAPHPKMGGGWCPAGYSSSDPAQKAAQKLAQQKQEEGQKSGAATASAPGGDGADPTSEAATTTSSQRRNLLYVAGGVAAGTAAALAAALLRSGK